ncbi:MAG: FecR domain-containing protein [Spirochaetes bacterium]|nr:FecR domain-containing protein [Spirochaetota bacterium]
MRESGRLEKILIKYKLALPIPYFTRRKILKSKRKTLVQIIKIEKYDSAFVSAAVYFSELLNRLGFRAGLAGGARAFAAAAAFSIIIIISSYLAVVYNYNRVSQFIVALTGIGVQEYQKGFVLLAKGDAKILRDNKELPAIKEKYRLITNDEIVTGADGTMVFQMEKKTLVRIMPESSGTAEIDLKAKSIYLRNGTVLCNVQDLERDEKFSVSTPNAVVFVTGTQFSVTYESERTRVAVLKGSVQAENLKSGETTLVDEGKAAVIFGYGFEMKDSEAAEKIILQRFGRVEYMEHIMNTSEREMEKFREAVIVMDGESEGAEEDIKIDTLDDIKRKYGRLEEIQLYNGKRYTGAIISRGGIYSFITVDGIKKIPAKDVKYVRIIK